MTLDPDRKNRNLRGQTEKTGLVLGVSFEVSMGVQM